MPRGRGGEKTEASVREGQVGPGCKGCLQWHHNFDDSMDESTGEGNAVADEALSRWGCVVPV